MRLRKEEGALASCWREVLSFIPSRRAGRTVVGLNECSRKAGRGGFPDHLVVEADHVHCPAGTIYFILPYLTHTSPYTYLTLHILYLTLPRRKLILHCFQPEARELSSSVGSLLGVNSVGELSTLSTKNETTYAAFYGKVMIMLEKIFL